MSIYSWLSNGWWSTFWRIAITIHAYRKLTLDQNRQFSDKWLENHFLPERWRLSTILLLGGMLQDTCCFEVVTGSQASWKLLRVHPKGQIVNARFLEAMVFNIGVGSRKIATCLLLSSPVGTHWSSRLEPVSGPFLYDGLISIIWS